MKIFALETNMQKLIKSILSPSEEIILIAGFSAFLFIMRSVRAFLLTLVFVGVGAGAMLIGAPPLWTVLILLLIWVPTTLFRWATALIDWMYDSLIVTTEEIVWINQSSLFHVTIRQMNLDNVASVSAETQYWNIFPFGKLHFDLKEGTGKALVLPYIPHAQRVATIISDSIVTFQRRRATMAQSVARGDPPEIAAKKAERIPAPGGA